MFICKFAEYLSLGAAFTFGQTNMPYFRRRIIYELVGKNLLYP
jgi:sentrin-specific protease 1